jgi:hypothetical protein
MNSTNFPNVQFPDRLTVSEMLDREAVSDACKNSSGMECRVAV